MTFSFQAPDLAEFPRRSYRKFLDETIGKLFADISPLASEPQSRFEITFVGADGRVHWRFDDYPAGSPYPASAAQARQTNMTHARRLLADVYLRDTRSGAVRKSQAYLGDLPVITERGTFVINGSERVVIAQLVRAPGVYFQTAGPSAYKALILGESGALSLELDLKAGSGRRAACRIKLPRCASLPALTVLAALGVAGTDLEEQILPLLLANGIEFRQMNQDEALLSLGRAFKADHASGLIAGHAALSFLKDKRGLVLGELGRRRLNQKLETSSDCLQLTGADILAATAYLLNLPLGKGRTDKIDSLEHRHLRGIGDLLAHHLRPALNQMAAGLRNRLALLEDEAEIAGAGELIDFRPFGRAVDRFFAGSPLVQYLDQQNPLAELSHRRRITPFGPGAVLESAVPAEMRDVHVSQIGRLCLIESSEGKNCGLVSYLATFCRIDEDGFLTVPYRKVVDGSVTDEVVYLSAADDLKYTLAPPDTRVENNRLCPPLCFARRGEDFCHVLPSEIDFIGMAPQGFVSIGSALIPFLEHDDANRALMGSGMMRQALPLIRPERPRVGTGMEKIVARSSGHALAASQAGTVVRVSGDALQIVQADGKTRNYHLVRYERSNQNTVLDQRPAVKAGDNVEPGQIIANGPSIEAGELALGRNLLVAFLPWYGQNYEDAIVVRRGLVRDHKLSHIEIEKHSLALYQTLRGPELLTPELPNAAAEELAQLDERGIVRIGSLVEPGSILVARLSPREQRALSAEDELLQAVFGKVAEDMTDTSLRVPHGSGGRVIDVRIFTGETTPELPAAVICQIEVLIARICPLEAGDKLSGRHGNKGIVSAIVADEDMPYLPDGTPVDICLNPLGVPSRMNVGQVLDSQLGLYADILNRYYRIHQFDEHLSADASCNIVREALAQARKLPGFEWLGSDGKVTLFDGRTGEPFDEPVLVGRQYMLKLNHLVNHKMNARCGLGGPYAAVTQQPVGGKARHGGQRVGEMEVWAVQAYGAAATLHEMMTVKADDIEGRHQVYSAIVRNKELSADGRSAGFEGLCCHMRGLALDLTAGQVEDITPQIAAGRMPEANEAEHQQLELLDEFIEAQTEQILLELESQSILPVSEPDCNIQGQKQIICSHEIIESEPQNTASSFLALSALSQELMQLLLSELEGEKIKPAGACLHSHQHRTTLKSTQAPALT